MGIKRWNGANTFFVINWNFTSHIFVKALKSQVQFWPTDITICKQPFGARAVARTLIGGGGV